MKLSRVVLGFILLAGAVGCRSRVIQVTLVNTSEQSLSTIIVDYPGATFGADSLAPGKTFVYKIKPIESGPLKLQFRNAQGANIHSVVLPVLHKGQEGSVEIRLTQDASTAVANIH